MLLSYCLSSPAPRSIVFPPRLARARVSLSCESTYRAHASAVCVQKLLSSVRISSVSYPGVTCVRNKPGCSTSGLSANQRRLNKILPSSCTVAKSLSYFFRSVEMTTSIPLVWANIYLLGTTPIKLKLCEPQGLCIIRAHTKFQLPTCKWAREKLG